MRGLFLSSLLLIAVTITTGDSVVVEYTGRLEDGTVFDTSREAVATKEGLADAQPDRDYNPLTVEVGAGRVIDGLEEGLIGLDQGASPTITIPPELGYGEWNDEHVRTHDVDEFKELVGGQLPEEGAYIETKDGGYAEIVHVDEQVVKVDFNHELAGETLEFDLEVITVN